MIVTTGGVPTVIATSAVSLPPRPSVTVTRAVYCPAAVYVCVTVAPLAPGVPSPNAHVTVSASPSGSADPALDSCTPSGAAPCAGVAAPFATGGRFAPVTAIRFTVPAVMSGRYNAPSAPAITSVGFPSPVPNGCTLCTVTPSAANTARRSQP